MPLIEISQEDLTFLKHLSQQLNAQDNRGTADPYFTIRTRTLRTSADGCGDTCVLYDSSSGTTYYTVEDALEAIMCDFRYGDVFKVDDDEEFEVEVDSAKSWKDVLDIIEINDIPMYQLFEMQYVEKNENCFLTEKSAQAHLDNNSHHYTNGFVYADSFWRNPEMQRLVKILKKI